MKIPILDIFIGERHRKDYGDIEDLASDFKVNGQITAITVRPANEDDREDPKYKGETYSLIAGGRRLMAAMRCGWTELDAMSREDAISKMKHILLELNENVKRKEMTLLEQVSIKKKMFTELRELDPELGQADFARMIGETAANTSRDLRVADIIEARPELRDAPSKKSILRADKMASHFEARTMRETPDLGNQVKQKLFTAKAEDWLRSQETGVAQLVLMDPPYALGLNTGGGKGKNSDMHISEYDDSEAVNQDLFFDIVPEVLRVTDPIGWIISFMSEAQYDFLKGLFESCCVEHFGYLEGTKSVCNGAVGSNAKCRFVIAEEPRWIWSRPNSQNPSRIPELHAKNTYEHLLVINRGGGKLMRPCDNLLSYPAEYGNRIHSMQKPLDLLKDLISRVTLAGELVIDPFFGSGSTLAAAAAMARDFRGCERNPNLLAPALGYVAQNYSGVAPRAARTEAAGNPDNIPF